MIKLIKSWLNKRKFIKGKNSSKAFVLTREENKVVAVLRQDNKILAKGDKVMFKGLDETFGPLEISSFNIYDSTVKEVNHCSALFKGSSTMCFSIGLLEHVD